MTTPDPTRVRAGGGLIIHSDDSHDEIHVLLIHRNGVWDLPKGKLEDNESIAACAVREVKEETGLDELPVIIADLGTTYHTYRDDSELIEKETFWFLMRLLNHTDHFEPQQDEGITGVEWATVDKAVVKVGYKNLEIVLNRFLDHRENLQFI